MIVRHGHALVAGRVTGSKRGGAMETNTDLRWDLKHIIHQQKAYNYMQQFRDVFCVYSESVCQLYSNYRLHYSDEYGENEIQILPDEHAWHETFDSVRGEAVRPSNIMLFPGELLGERRFFHADAR